MSFQFDISDFQKVSDFKADFSTDPAETYECGMRVLCDEIVTLLGTDSDELLVLEASIDDCPQLHNLEELLQNEESSNPCEYVNHENTPAGASVKLYQRNNVKFVVTADWNGNCRIFVRRAHFDMMNEYVTSLDLQEDLE